LAYSASLDEGGTYKRLFSIEDKTLKQNKNFDSLPIPAVYAGMTL
jgi:hypothetical protein